jgi:hypothetical protein
MGSPKTYHQHYQHTICRSIVLCFCIRHIVFFLCRSIAVLKWHFSCFPWRHVTRKFMTLVSMRVVWRKLCRNLNIQLIYKLIKWINLRINKTLHWEMEICILCRHGNECDVMRSWISVVCVLADLHITYYNYIYLLFLNRIQNAFYVLSCLKLCSENKN